MKKICRILTVLLLAFIMAVPFAGNAFAKSGKVNVYVITKVTTTAGDSKRTDKLAYNKKGLLVQSDLPDLGYKKITYNKKNQIKSAVFVDIEGAVFDGVETKITCKYNKKGQLSKIIPAKKDSMGNEVWTKGVTLKYKNGKISTQTFKYPSRDPDTDYSTIKYTFSHNKKGKYIKIKKVNSDNPVYQGFEEFKYDEYGNICGTNADGSEEWHYWKNKYIKGLLKKRDFDYGDRCYTYTYKKISVDKSLVKTIKAQQWALLNHNINCALPTTSVYYNYGK